jgi:hypothetical protein
VASSRAVKIPTAKGAARAVRLPVARPVAPPGSDSPVAGPGDVRANTVALGRARRLVAIYLVALAAMYAAFVAIDLTGPAGGSTATSDGVLIFSGVAAALAVGGLVLTLSPAPRAVEVTSSSLVVIEWTGRRREFPALEDLRVEVVRRYPAGFLASAEVEAVEISGGARARTYQLTQGLLPERRPRPAPTTG